jgi:hypothetical protein
LKQTLRLSLSEFDQLVTSFAYCYDNDMRPWCAGPAVGSNALPVSSVPLGPTLKRLNAPLEQFVNVSILSRGFSVLLYNFQMILHNDLMVVFDTAAVECF